MPAGVDTRRVNPGHDGDSDADLETLDPDPSDAKEPPSALGRRFLRPASLLPWALAGAVIAVVSVAALDDGPTLPRHTAVPPITPSSAVNASTIPEPVVVEKSLRRGEQKCPADRAFADSLAHATVADMTRRGAADGLPEDGATTLDRVEVAARENGAEIRKSQRNVISITAGRGLGWTFSQRADLSVIYHKVNDFQVVVHLRYLQNCPPTPSFVSNDRGERVPSLYVYRSIP